MNECSKVPAHGTAEPDDVKQSSSGTGFKLTYATMFDSPPELHEGYERALAELKPGFGRRYPMRWGGQDHESSDVFEDRSPTDGTILGYFPRGTERDAADALAAARAAAPGWAATPWQERVRIMRAAADLLEERVFTLGAILSLEVGKNRDESLGDAAEAVEMIRYACNHMERTNGLTTPMGSDPLRGRELEAPAVAGRFSASPVWCLGRHQPVQLSVVTDGRADRRRACCGQHRRHQAGHGDTVGSVVHCSYPAGRWRSRGRGELRDGSRLDPWPIPD